MAKTLAAALIFLLCGFGAAHAAFIDNGNNLIYDTVKNVTWYEPAYNPMTWTYATGTWAPGLTVGGTTAGSWSLPTTPGTTFGYTNEGQMGNLYYNELGNAAGGPPANLVPFANIVMVGYWTGAEYAPSSPYAWLFYMYNGDQTADLKGDTHAALAVHAGDVGAPVPIPGAALLFAPGLVGLAAMRRRLKK